MYGLRIFLNQPMPEKGLAQRHGNCGRIFRNFCSNSHCFGQHLFTWQHVIEKAGACLLFGSKNSSRVHEFRGLWDAHKSREKPG